MDWWLAIPLSFGLAIDAFSVAVVLSAVLGTVTGKHIFRLAFHFGLFHTLVPLGGWAAGRSITRWVAAWDHWLAFGILVAAGVHVVVEGLRARDEGQPKGDPTRGWSLVVLSFGTSIDTFAVGMSVAWLSANIWLSVALIGSVTALLTAVGMALGSRLGARFGHRVSVLGGLVLVGIGVKILCSHLWP